MIEEQISLQSARLLDRCEDQGKQDGSKETVAKVFPIKSMEQGSVIERLWLDRHK